MSEIKLLKITNPMWMQALAPRVVSYCEKINSPNLTYESMMTYLTHVVQFGGDMSEFWVAFKDDAPVGFCLWCTMGMPYIGTVHCDQLHIWDKDPEISREFLKQLLKYAESKRAPFIHGLMVNSKVADHFTEMGPELGIQPIISERVELYGRRT